MRLDSLGRWCYHIDMFGPCPLFAGYQNRPKLVGRNSLRESRIVADDPNLRHYFCVWTKSQWKGEDG